jgi:beta-lactamase regulating signal transducer with metallopeptidase domain
MNGLLNLFSEPWVQRLGWVLIHFLWQGWGVALLLAVALRFSTRASSHFRYVVIGSAFLLCAVLPVATWTILGLQAQSSVSPKPTPNIPGPSGVEAPTPSGLTFRPDVRVESSGHAGIPWQDKLKQVANASLPYVVGLWSGGVLILTLRLTLGWTLTRWLCLSGLPVQDSLSREKFQSLLERMQVGVPVRLLQSTLIEVPTLIGWLRPTILIPASVLIGLTPDQLDAILAHELAHVRRYDYLVNLFQTVIETILFYHPAVWWISRKLREERENCCDDIALEVMQDRLVYASALAQLEQGRSLPLALTASGGSLLQRIRRIVVEGRERTQTKATSGLFLLLAVALIGGCVTISLGDQIAPTQKNAETAGKLSKNANDAKSTRVQFQLIEITESDYKMHRVEIDAIAKKGNDEALRRLVANKVLAHVRPFSAPLKQGCTIAISDGVISRMQVRFVVETLNDKISIRGTLSFAKAAQDSSASNGLQEPFADELTFDQRVALPSSGILEPEGALGFNAKEPHRFFLFLTVSPDTLTTDVPPSDFTTDDSLLTAVGDKRLLGSDGAGMVFLFFRCGAPITARCTRFSRQSFETGGESKCRVARFGR